MHHARAHDGEPVASGCHQDRGYEPGFAERLIHDQVAARHSEEKQRGEGNARAVHENAQQVDANDCARAVVRAMTKKIGKGTY